MFVINDMLSCAVAGKKSPKEAVEWAEKKIRPICAAKPGQEGCRSETYHQPSDRLPADSGKS